ncbi:hypothetical protein [Pseudooctadecabacter jejudonensis]|uniref:hypothetical protein n=1 Tax=Pseudooctadecabacter jejudonensis TaxID=1391910 RepID=UPI001F3B298A|nr:hypothetical protein [Pseudooctadecabacter jejudonensis]
MASDTAGTRCTLQPGNILQDMGKPIEACLGLISGEVEAIDARTGKRYRNGTLAPTQVFGEISVLSGSKALWWPRGPGRWRLCRRRGHESTGD